MARDLYPLFPPMIAAFFNFHPAPHGTWITDWMKYPHSIAVCGASHGPLFIRQWALILYLDHLFTAFGSLFPRAIYFPSKPFPWAHNVLRWPYVSITLAACRWYVAVLRYLDPLSPPLTPTFDTTSRLRLDHVDVLSAALDSGVAVSIIIIFFWCVLLLRSPLPLLFPWRCL